MANKANSKELFLNQVTNGTTIRRLTLGNMPTKMRRQTDAARAYRRGLEQAVLDAKGEISVTDCHLIDAAAGAELHQAVCRWILREKLEKMSVADITKCSAEIMKSRETRNRAVKQLGLDEEPEPVRLKDYIDGKVVE